jgi:hypothetical protein
MFSSLNRPHRNLSDALGFGCGALGFLLCLPDYKGQRSNGGPKHASSSARSGGLPGGKLCFPTARPSAALRRSFHWREGVQNKAVVLIERFMGVEHVD